ncbi:MAG: hypothetical protein GXY83_18740 [Rhodopirellula sp.]|nr:hypothetical protein [Rhodopirellula sp.]
MTSALAVIMFISFLRTSTSDTKPPSFEQVERAIRDSLQSRPDVAQGGIISRSDAEVALQKAESLGWKTPDRAEILDAVLPDTDYVVQQLRTSDGKRFSAKIDGLTGAFDRLDRLARLPHGKQTVRDLIQGKGGDRLIEYLTNTPGGAEMGRMLSKTPSGSQFNKPTGRIYTIEMLLARMKRR